MLTLQKIGKEIFWDSVKFTWDSSFVDALGPGHTIEIKPKSNTGLILLKVRYHGYDKYFKHRINLRYPCHVQVMYGPVHEILTLDAYA